MALGRLFLPRRVAREQGQRRMCDADFCVKRKLLGLHGSEVEFVGLGCGAKDDRVAAGEIFDDVTVEVTPVGDTGTRWVHAVRSLVLTNADGDPDCLVLVIRDATDQASAEERFERAFGTNPAPAIICRLTDLRYIKVNRGFLGMTGYQREDVVDRSVYEIDVLENAERKDLAIELLNEGRMIPQMEASLRLPNGDSKYVIVAGQPIEIATGPP